MSQLFDYFVCSRPLINEWAEALATASEDSQAEVEAKMPRMTTLRNLGPDEFSILACCIQTNSPDVVEAVGDRDLVRAITEEGPWIEALSQCSIESVARMAVDDELLERWVKAVVEFHGGDEGYYRAILTTDAAVSLREICQHAVDHSLELFVCCFV